MKVVAALTKCNIAVLAVCALHASCRSQKSEVTRQVSASGGDIPSALRVARRPEVEFYLQKVGDRCEVYDEVLGVKGVGKDAACPAEMLLGERLQIVGMVCMLQSAEPSRRLPTVCPDSLTNFERDYRTRNSVPLAGSQTPP